MTLVNTDLSHIENRVIYLMGHQYGKSQLQGFYTDYGAWMFDWGRCYRWPRWKIREFLIEHNPLINPWPHGLIQSWWSYENELEQYKKLQAFYDGFAPLKRYVDPNPHVPNRRGRMPRHLIEQQPKRAKKGKR